MKGRRQAGTIAPPHRLSVGPRRWLWLVLVGAGSALAADEQTPDCLYVSSYHRGYEWNDGIEQGLVASLGARCRLDRFYMDTKRNGSDSFGQAAGIAAAQYIETTHPDIVIACDDAAAKFMVQPFFRDSALSIVFCGINGSVEPYGFPYPNVTGMVEVAPVRTLADVLSRAVPGARQAVYLAPENLSQGKEFALNRGIYAERGITLDPLWVHDFAQWQEGFLRAQSAPFVVLASNGGLPGWDDEQARQFVLTHTRTLTVTNMEWMAPISALAITKDAQEQGEWAGQAALAILDGIPPSDIPVVVNRRWNLFISPGLLAQSGVELPSQIWHKALRIGNPP